MPQPNADHDYELVYTVRQRTTSRDPQKVVQAFYDELKLQYGSSVALSWVQCFDLTPGATSIDPPTKVPIEIPEHTYQQQRETGEVVEPEGDVVVHVDVSPST